YDDDSAVLNDQFLGCGIDENRDASVERCLHDSRTESGAIRADVVLTPVVEKGAIPLGERHVSTVLDSFTHCETGVHLWGQMGEALPLSQGLGVDRSALDIAAVRSRCRRLWIVVVSEIREDGERHTRVFGEPTQRQSRVHKVVPCEMWIVQASTGGGNVLVPLRK